MKLNDTTGIILAGGRSSRMGEDKSFLPLGGKNLIEIVIDALSPLFKHLTIITNKPHLYLVRNYVSNSGRLKNDIRIESDILKDRGPLGGIHAGLIYSTTMYNFVVACDMPFLNQNLIKFMLEEIKDYDTVIPKHNGLLEPLCAAYSKNCIKPIEEELSKNNLKIVNFLKYVKVKIISEEEVKNVDPDELSFENINTPGDYRRFEYERI